MSGHLTVIDADQQARIDATPPGTMGWVGGGPPGASCFECLHFARPDKPRSPELMRRCGRFVRWHKAQRGLSRAPRHLISPQTPACSSFVPRAAVTQGEAVE